MIYGRAVVLYRFIYRKIHVKTLQVVEVYRASHGAHVGVVTVSPQLPTQYAFIHG